MQRHVRAQPLDVVPHRLDGLELDYFLVHAAARDFLHHVAQPHDAVLGRWSERDGLQLRAELLLPLHPAAVQHLHRLARRAVDEVGGAERTLLKFSPLLAPVKAAVLPLSKKDPALLEIARRVHDDLKRRYNVQWDAAGNIGRRYRRQDEIGTPLCITVDFDSIEDGCVTVRDRDSTDQVRVKVEDVAAHVVHVIEGL